jgi:hypothetical protein
VIVTFVVANGGGTVTGASATTDASGVAAVGSWTLGTHVGINTLAASIGAIRLIFTANGDGGAPAALAKRAGDAQVATPGATLPALLQARVTDANDNPVSGVAVAFAVTSGGGTLTPASPWSRTPTASSSLERGPWVRAPASIRSRPRSV